MIPNLHHADHNAAKLLPGTMEIHRQRL